MQCGHFTAYVKNNSAKTWFMYNDDHTEVIAESSMKIRLEQQGSDGAYILFYEKVLG